jgi:hypothetical protein
MGIVFQTGRPARAWPEPDLAWPYAARPYAARWIFRAGPCQASYGTGGPGTTYGRFSGPGRHDAEDGPMGHDPARHYHRRHGGEGRGTGGA